ncbi:MAG: hypothetical protein JWL75_372 [Parcubacteria group bacterium]|nr:hypothetical protein [Parcubacteria group bacterium]
MASRKKVAKKKILKKAVKKTVKKPVPKKKKEDKYVVVSNKGYGNALKGIKIYYEGKMPKGLSKEDGSISFGKHILEALKRKFGNERFRWIITPEEDSIKFERGIQRIRTSQKTLKRMGDTLRDRTRDIKNDTVANFFSIVYPSHFTHSSTPVYVAGTLSHMLNGEIIPRLSAEDREAMNTFLPDYIASESLNTVNLLKAGAQIKTLKELATNLEKALDGTYSEGWWQTYIKGNILIIQQGYISAIEKMNVAIGGTKYPDFMLVTHDNYLDILEIKKPNTQLLKYDAGRKNYYWDPEIAKAIIQVENYIEFVQHQADVVRNYIRDTYGIELKVVRPRGIILAGDTRKFSPGKERDDFRLLCQSTKNIVFVTYDELLSRLQNYIKVLEDHSK